MVLAARREALEEGCREHRSRDPGVDGGLHRPPAFARVGHAPGEPVERRVGLERRRREVEEPRRDHRSATPQLGHLRGVDVELVELRLLQRRDLGRVLGLAHARVGVVEDVEALGERRHDPVLDAVVDHLHEMSCAGRSAVQVALLLRGLRAGSAGRAGDVARSRRDRLQYGLDRPERLLRSADHEAVAAVEAEDAAARADVDVVDALVLQRGRAPDVVAVVRVAAVDDDVAGLEDSGDLVDDLPRDPRGDHEPHHARRLQLRRQVGDRVRAGRAVRRQRLDGALVHVVDDAVVPVAHEPAHDVGAHPSEPDHSQLHARSSRRPAALDRGPPEVYVRHETASGAAGAWG